MRNCSAPIIRVLWFSGLGLAASLGLLAQHAKPSAPASPPPATSKDTPLGALVKAYRQSPSPARRAAVEAYAKAHAANADGALARLALGVAAYEQKDYPGAVAALKDLSGRLPRIADYAVYYLAAAQVELKSAEGVAKELAAVHAGEVPSPLAGRAWLVEARALTVPQPAESVRMLREHYAG